MWLLACMKNVLMIFFFFNDTATTEIYTLSLHDALPIWLRNSRPSSDRAANTTTTLSARRTRRARDRKSTRLNSSHANISYAVFCLKKKKKHKISHHSNPPDDYQLTSTTSRPEPDKTNS